MPSFPPPSLIDHMILHDLCRLAECTPAGDFVEIGVYRGGSAYSLAAVALAQGRRLFLFDTFTGMPEWTPQVDTHRPGDFADTSLEAVRAAIPSAIFKVGFFPDTLTDDVGPIAFAHIDCDQYVTTKAACERLASRMVVGGVMVFDDYPCLAGARRAVDETFGGLVERTATGKAVVTF